MKNKLKLSKKKAALLLGILIALLVIIGVGIFVYRNQNSTVQPDPQEEVQSLTLQVGKLMDLPVDEEPVIATVSDATKLVDQPFFAKALNGDKVLAYTKNKKAILYRPSTNKIIEVTFYNPAPEGGAATASAQQASVVRIAVYNGTQTAGLAKKQADFIEANIDNVEVVTTANSKENYESTVIVDLNGNHRDVADKLAEELRGGVRTFPSAEEKPANADILVILGSSE